MTYASAISFQVFSAIVPFLMFAVVMSGGSGFYLTEVASYGSVFGSQDALVVLIGYVYASALVFLGGVQIDALVREGARAAEQGSYAADGAPA